MITFKQFLLEHRNIKEFEGMVFHVGGWTGHDYQIYKDGKHIGKAIVDPWQKQMHNIELHPQYRGKGYAATIYRFAEKQLGQKLNPSKSQTPAAKAFWKKYRPEASEK